MADSTTKLSGYLNAAITITWASGQSLNSLNDNEWTDLSDEIDNSTNKWGLADFELVLGSASYNGTDSSVEMYIVPSVDGSQYPTWTGNVTTDEQENQAHYKDFFILTGSTAAQVATCGPVMLPNGKFRVGLRNRGNAATPSSGNTLKYRPHGWLADEA
jgi:hypothetical protein